MGSQWYRARVAHVKGESLSSLLSSLLSFFLSFFLSFVHLFVRSFILPLCPHQMAGAADGHRSDTGGDKADNEQLRSVIRSCWDDLM